MKLLYPAIFSPCSEGGYTVLFPDLQGCVTEGDSLQEAVEMAEDAACGWILTAMEEGENLPKASPISEVHAVQKDDFVNLIVLDMDEYARKYGNAPVRCSVEIPAWLCSYGEEHNINLSRLVENSLLKMAQEA